MPTCAGEGPRPGREQQGVVEHVLQGAWKGGQVFTWTEGCGMAERELPGIFREVWSGIWCYHLNHYNLRDWGEAEVAREEVVGTAAHPGL